MKKLYSAIFIVLVWLFRGASQFKFIGVTFTVSTFVKELAPHHQNPSHAGPSVEHENKQL